MNPEWLTTISQIASGKRFVWNYGKIPQMKVRDVIKLIEADGWYVAVMKGSHRQYKHANKPGRFTIAGHPSDEMSPGTLNSVLKQSQLKKLKKSERL